MDPSEAEELCSRKYRGPEIEKETLHSLLRKLEYLPLAITQATAFISENGSNVQDYLKLLESESKKLLSTDIEDQRRYPGVPHSVMNTWRVSFDMIKKEKPRAADMLSQMCYYNRQEIQKRLLVGEFGDGIDFITALGMLKSYRFIKADKGDTSFDMHALVQLATKLWIEDENKTEKYSALALKSVSRNFPAGDFRDRLLCEKLLLHAKAVLEEKQTTSEHQLNKAELLHNTAWYTAEQGNIRDAEKWLEEAVKIRQEHLGVGESATLYSMHNLARAYSDMGKPKDAVKLQERVVKLINTKEGGDNNPDSLEAMSQLGTMYLALGMWSQAESLGKRVVENSEAAEEEEEVDVLRRKISLAEIYKNTGKHELSQGLAEAVVQRLQEMVAEDKESHQAEADTDNHAFPSPTLDAMLGAMHTLAMIYRDRGKLKEAAKIGKQVMDERTKRLGDEHPSTLDITSDMALLYEDQGQFEEAQRLGEWVVGTSKTLLGAEHPATLSSISNLTSVLEKMGQLEEAESLARTVIKASTSILGENHRTSLLSMGNLASIYRSRGKLEDAAELGRRVLKMRKDTLEKNHPDVLMGVTNLASTYHKKGSFVEMRETLLSVKEPQCITISGIHTSASISPTLPPTPTTSGIRTAASISPAAPPRKIFTIDRAVVVLLLVLFLYY
jgi:tetratricopeptide (TPR) repeat protein